MKAQSHLHVSNPPARPLLLWDGECGFCRLWIERLKIANGARVDYATSQDEGARFLEIPADEFKRAVVLVVPEGTIFTGAEAVYRALACGSAMNWLAWSYDHVPGVAALSDFGYRIIARHRAAASVVTRILWGKDVSPPTYFWARRWFLRVLGLVYLIAFVSLWTQVDGLVAVNGILPVSQFLPAVHEQIGGRAYYLLPTLCWLNESNPFLHFLCAAGVILSLLLILRIASAICLIGLFVFYLSLTIAGQAFLSFQWDILLLEVGFLAIFFAPWRLWPGKGGEGPVSAVGLFLIKLLLFKLMIMSGVVKLTSYQFLSNPAEDTWWNLTALDYHYWSQPLPTIFAWWADQAPEWFKKLSVAVCLFIEIVVPFFLWAPRRLRLIACGLLIFLQLAIALTGNYCFFNLLTIALCLLLIDDSIWRRRRGAIQGVGGTRGVVSKYSWLAKLPVVALLIFTLPVNAWHILNALKPLANCPQPIRFVRDRLAPFNIASGYGLFRVMTKERREIVLEGSADGTEWRPYEFKWKPGEVNRAPGWCAPHQPRLDWQMWFAALESPDQNRWFIPLMISLLEDKQDVIRLFARNPFPDAPPRYVRAILYQYRFTTAPEHRETGAWWTRQKLGEYLPEASLR